MPEIVFLKENKRIQANIGSNLREMAIEDKISVYQNILTKLFNCRGMGFCGTCKVLIESGEMEPPNEVENKKLKNDLKINPNIRLACQLEIKGDLEIKTL